MSFRGVSTRIVARRPGVLWVVGLVVMAAGELHGAAATDTSAASYERADVETIHAYTREIVSNPRFTPRITFRQWLMNKLSNWDGPDLDVPGWAIEFIGWAVITWCVLTLLAILVHLGWTIWLLARPSAGRAGAEAHGADGLYETLSCEQLWQRSRELAARGAFREAAGVLLLALLRQLETAKALSFHKSKTNGEYLREYPGDLAGRQEFVQLVATFERSVYGGLEIAGRTYETMHSLAEQIVSHASQKQ